MAWGGRRDATKCAIVVGDVLMQECAFTVRSLNFLLGKVVVTICSNGRHNTSSPLAVLLRHPIIHQAG